MVSLVLSFPVLLNDKIQYRSVPLTYWLCNKKKTKFVLTAELVDRAMELMGDKHQLILLCDNWYPKNEAAALIERQEKLDMICNARIDTVLYNLPLAPIGKRGRPRKLGDRLCLEQFELAEPKAGGWKA